MRSLSRTVVFIFVVVLIPLASPGWLPDIDTSDSSGTSTKGPDSSAESGSKEQSGFDPSGIKDQFRNYIGSELGGVKDATHKKSIIDAVIAINAGLKPTLDILDVQQAMNPLCNVEEFNKNLKYLQDICEDDQTDLTDGKVWSVLKNLPGQLASAIKHITEFKKKPKMEHHGVTLGGVINHMRDLGYQLVPFGHLIPGLDYIAYEHGLLDSYRANGLDT